MSCSGLSPRAGSGSTRAATGPEAALEKIHRVLPATLGAGSRRSRRRSRSPAATAGVPVDGATCSCSPTRSGAGTACTRRTRSYSGERSQRELSPHGLVVHSGRWYLAAHDHGPGRPADVSRRPDGRPSIRDAAARRRTSSMRSRTCAVARERAMAWEVECCSTSRWPSRRADPVDARRARRAGRADAAPHARRLARLDGRCWPVSAAASRVDQPPELRDSVRSLAARLVSQVS